MDYNIPDKTTPMLWTSIFGAIGAGLSAANNTLSAAEQAELERQKAAAKKKFVIISISVIIGITVLIIISYKLFKK